MVTNDRQEIEGLQAQLVELQSQLAFQEDVISALDAVVTRQQQQIANLQELWESQKRQLEEVNSRLDMSPAVERPPHY